MCGFPPFCEDAEVFENVILCMSPDPGPNVIIDRLHHPMLSMFDSDFEALCLTFAGQRSRATAYGAIWIHPDDRGLGSPSRFGSCVFMVSGGHLSTRYSVRRDRLGGMMCDGGSNV